MPARTPEQEAQAQARRERAEQERARNRAAMENYEIRDHGEHEGYDSISEDIPLWGEIDGSAARQAERRAATEADRNRQLWERLAETAPGIDDLTPEYSLEARGDEYGDLLMGPSELEGPGLDPRNQRAALGQIGTAQSALAELMRGGMTSADRQALTAQRLQQGAQLRGANQAAVQQMGARGMGGGGAELAARLAGSQDYANANAMGDANIMGQAQNRALGAMQSYGQLGSAYGGIAGQMQGQEMARRQAIDSYNQSNTDWRRGRETRNTAWSNQGADRAAEAHQQSFDNRLRTTAGAAGHNPVAAGSEDRQRQAESARNTIGGLGGLLEGLFS